MSDRIPGSSPYNPIRYGKWMIYVDYDHYDPYVWIHPDYEPSDPYDKRYGHAATEEAAISAIENCMMVRAMGSANRPGVFRDHNCWKCNDGERPCVNGKPRACEYLHARND